VANEKATFEILDKAGADFINVLQTAFACANPKSAKNLTVFFALSGSVCEKAPHLTLMKLTPGLNLKIILIYMLKELRT